MSEMSDERNFLFLVTVCVIFTCIPFQALLLIMLAECVYVCEVPCLGGLGKMRFL
jgi:hypothetical protein